MQIPLCISVLAWQSKAAQATPAPPSLSTCCNCSQDFFLRQTVSLILPQEISEILSTSITNPSCWANCLGLLAVCPMAQGSLVHLFLTEPTLSLYNNLPPQTGTA